MADVHRLTALLNCDLLENNHELRDLLSDFFAEDVAGFSDSDSDASDAEICDADAEYADEEESDRPLVSVETVGVSNGTASTTRTHVVEASGGGDVMEVHAAVPQLQQGCDVLERARLRCCKANGTGCKQIKVPDATPGDTRRGCITQFDPEEIVALQLSVQDIDKGAQEMLILGILGACMRTGPRTECCKRKEQTERKKPRSSYCLLQRPVCKDAFLYLLGISQDKLTRLHKHYQEEGFTPTSRKAGGRKNNIRSLTVDDTRRVVRFILNFAEDYAVALPGRVPGFRQEDIRLLPSSYPKKRIFRLYEVHARESGYREIRKPTFYNLWKELCPYIIVAKPMTDLCWRCQRNNTHIYHSANLTLEQKQELLAEHQGHLSQVEAERKLYNDMTAESQAVAQQHQLQQLQKTPANSKPFTMHYSFDFAQQVHYPSNAAQPGPLYFLTPRKCGIFGVHCEGLSKQVNFLIDEGVSSSKGSVAVLSYIHHFLQNYGLGEQHLTLHCDNCSGQNKNRWVLFYFAWRVMKGLHTTVSINFMPPGHTKFAPDWCFGLLKKTFRRSHVSCLEDLVEVVRESTPVGHNNIPQLVGLEDGTVNVPTYNWHEFFQGAFKTLPGIKPIGHFFFTRDEPGKVFYKETLADEQQSATLAVLDGVANLPPMPNIIPPPGLPLERQRYLYNNIREYIPADRRDVVCPAPAP